MVSISLRLVCLDTCVRYRYLIFLLATSIEGYPQGMDILAMDWKNRSRKNQIIIVQYLRWPKSIKNVFLIKINLITNTTKPPTFLFRFF